MPKAVKQSLEGLPFTEKDVVGWKNGIPIIRNKQLAKLGIIIPEKSKKTPEEPKKATTYDKFNDTLKKFKASNKLDISRDDRLQAWAIAKQRVQEKKIKPTRVGFTNLFNELWLSDDDE